MKVTVWNPVYRVLVRIGKAAAGVTLITGALIGGFEYYEKKQDERSLELYKRFYQEPYITLRGNISRALFEEKGRIDQSLRKEIDIDFNRLMLEIVRDRKIETEVLFMLEFYEAVAFCISNKLCDGGTALALFRDSASRYWLNFYAYIQANRQASSPTFASGLEMVANFGREPASQQAAAF